VRVVDWTLASENFSCRVIYAVKLFGTGLGEPRNERHLRTRYTTFNACATHSLPRLDSFGVPEASTTLSNFNVMRVKVQVEAYWGAGRPAHSTRLYAYPSQLGILPCASAAMLRKERLHQRTRRHRMAEWPGFVRWLVVAGGGIACDIMTVMPHSWG